MDKKYIVALGIRVAALFYLVYIIKDGAQYLFILTNYDEESKWIIMAAIVLTLLLVFGLLLLKFPLRFAGKLLPKSDEATIKTNYTPQDIQTVAFTLLGLFILTTSVPNLFYWLIVIQQYKSSLPVIELQPENIANFFSTILELLIGFWLFIRCQRSARDAV